MRKYIAAALLAAVLIFSGCGNDTLDTDRVTNVFVCMGEGYDVSIATVTWKEAGKPVYTTDMHISRDDENIVPEYDMKLSWLSNSKEIHLAENQSLDAHQTGEYKDGILMVAEVETRDNGSTYQLGLFLCNGEEIKDVTPLDSEGNPPVAVNNEFEASGGEDGTVPVFGFTDTDGDTVRYQLDFDNLRILPLGHPQED